MKKLIIGIVMVMAFAVSARAEIALATQNFENVHNYALKNIPDATPEEITKCYEAVKNGPEFTIQRQKIKITCDKEEMIVFRRLF